MLVTYAGYIISTRQMKPWFGWLRWLDPIYYSFEALMSNEFTGQTFECAPNQLVPYGEGYTSGSNQGCAIAGSVAGVSRRVASFLLRFDARMLTSRPVSSPRSQPLFLERPTSQHRSLCTNLISGGTSCRVRSSNRQFESS